MIGLVLKVRAHFSNFSEKSGRESSTIMQLCRIRPHFVVETLDDSTKKRPRRLISFAGIDAS
jgi:hypothetical protein